MNGTVAVVGGGVGGLATAWWVRRRAPDAQVVVLEAGQRPGGVISSVWVDGILCEAGAHGILDNAQDTRDLLEGLGLTARWRLASPAAGQRHVLRHGRFMALPASASAILSSSLFSLRGRLRLLREPFVAPRAGDDATETLWEFGARRLGPEVANVAADALAASVFGGDAHQLEMQSCFPQFRHMEKQHGSLFRGMAAAEVLRKQTGAAPPALRGFDHGMAELTGALATALGPRIRLGHRVRALNRRTDRRWEVAIDGHGPLFADHVVLAVPSSTAAELLQPWLAPWVHAGMDRVPYAPVDILFHSVDRAQVPHAAADVVAGSGFVVPSAEGSRLGIHVLGTQCTRSIFPQHGPPDRVVLRTLMGGARNPQVGRWSTQELVVRGTQEVAHVLGLRTPPVLHHVVRWKHGIPQYPRGHARRVQQLEATVAGLGGMHLAGNAWHGVGVNGCIRLGRAVAQAVTG